MWLAENWASVLIILALAAAVAAAVIKIIRDRRHHKHCGTSCSGCPMSGTCHKEKG